MGKSPDLADLPEVARVKRIRRVTWSVVLVLVAGAIFSARPALHAAKSWRARAIMQEALELASASGQREHALSSARAAYRLAPNDPAVVRGTAQILQRQQDWPAALAFWKEALAREPIPNASTRRGIVESALQAGEYGEAGKQLEILLAAASVSAQDRHLSARFHRQTGSTSLAIAAAREAVRIEPSYDPASFFLAECLLEHPDSRAEGLALLRKLSASPSEAGLAALQRRATFGFAEPAELEEIAGALRSHPLAAEGHRLQALSLDLRRQPDARERVLDSAAEHYRASAPEILRQFAAWLLGEGEPERALAMVSEAQALSRKDLLLVRLDAFAALKDWKGTLRLLEMARVPLEESSRSLYRARCYAELGEARRAENAWRNALDTAGRDPGLLQYVGSYAERFGEIETSRAAYRQLALNPLSARLGFEGLLRHTPQGDTAAARDTLAQMAERWPRDQQVANDLAYLNALLAHEVPHCAEKARELVRAAPASLPHRTVLALAELRLGNHASALETFQGLEVDWRRAAPASVVVYAAALEANGRDHEARALAALASSDRLRPEERALKPGSSGTM